MKAFRTQVIGCGLFLDRLPQTIIMFAAIAFGVQGLEHVMNGMPAFIMSGSLAASSMMTGIGFAILISMIWNREIGWFFFIGYVFQKYLQLPTVAIAIIAGVMAFTYFCMERNSMISSAWQKTKRSSPRERRICSDGKVLHTQRRRKRPCGKCSGTPVWCSPVSIW